jgi:hypothetical protein
MGTKLVAVLLLVGIVVGALELGDALRLPARSSEKADRAPLGQYEAEEEWAGHVNAICEREKEQVKTLLKAFRHMSTPRDFEFLLESGLRIGEANIAVFLRLDPPLTFRRETRELKRLLRAEHTAAERLLDAFRAGKRRAFLRHLRALFSADARSTRLLVQLGASECGVKPLRSYPESRELAV